MPTEWKTRSCPLCRQDLLAARGGRQRWVRAQNMHASLSEIRAGRRSVPELRSTIAQMCVDCQTLMLGISSDLDQRELETRMERSIQEIEQMAREHAA
jgi:hypothetical protein